MIDASDAWLVTDQRLLATGDASDAWLVAAGGLAVTLDASDAWLVTDQRLLATGDASDASLVTDQRLLATGDASDAWLVTDQRLLATGDASDAWLVAAGGLAVTVDASDAWLVAAGGLAVTVDASDAWLVAAGGLAITLICSGTRAAARPDASNCSRRGTTGMRKADHVRDQPERRHLVEGIESTANVGGHPIHPMLVLFPAAFLVGALVTDIVYAFNGAIFWADASIWLVGAGLVMGAIAGIAGATDFFTLHRPRQLTIGWVHAIGNVGVVILSLANLLIRVDDPATAILPWGLVLSIIVSATLLVTGWAGGELAYRHGIGVVGEGSPMGTGLDEEAREHERERALDHDHRRAA